MKQGGNKMAAQAWAENGVITRDDGFSVRWKPRCPYCGHVPTNRDCGGTASQGVRAHQYASCDKCGKSFDVIISRG